MNKKKEWIIFLRAFACMAVVMIHVIDGWLVSANIKLNGSRFILDEIIIQPLIRWAVPIFIMISGYLLLDPKKDITIKKIIKYINRMFLILLTFGFFYCILENLFTYGIGNLWKILYLSLFNLIQGKSWTVMWYIYLLIGLYIITPILRCFIKNASNEEIKFVVISLMLLSIFIPTINRIFNIELTTFYLDIFEYITIYLLGYVIANNYFDKKYIYCFGIIGILGYILCSINNILLCDQNGIFIVLMSIFIFYYFSNNSNKFKNNKVIERISNDSFGIYLVHTFWLNVLNKGFKLYPSSMPILAGELTFFITVLLISIVSVEILKKLPLFKSIL